MSKKIHSHTHFYAIIAVLALMILLPFFTDQKTKAASAFSKENTVPSACNKTGSPVINVTQKVVNSVDSGEAGNYWAFDSYNRQIQVWVQADGEYCAVVNYEGKFDAQEGQRSPGNTAVLTGEEDGAFKGGYQAVITGVLRANPSWPQKGSLGTIDYQCDILGNCPGALSWTEQYFDTGATGFTFDYIWWGWEYHTVGQNVWVNSMDGNSGDIL